MTSIAFIHPFLYRYPRGIERYIVNLSTTFAQIGINVDILTWKWPHEVHWPDLDPLVNINAFPTTRYFAASAIVPFYVGHLLTNKYDHVFIHFADYGEGLAFQILNWLKCLPSYSIVLHFPFSQVPHRYETLKKNNLFKYAQSIIGVSEFVSTTAEKYIGRSCLTISHGVDIKRFKPDSEKRNETRNELNIDKDTPVLLTVSALEERKGVQWVLRALPLILEDFPDLIYLIVGQGHYQNQLEEITQNLGVQDAVRFIPATTEISRYYQAADIKLILSLGEASSIVSLESLACQTPVISSQHPPFDELINPRWGDRVEESDPYMIFTSVKKLLNNPALRKKMGEAGRYYILSNHTWPIVAAQYLEYLQYDKTPQ